MPTYSISGTIIGPGYVNTTVTLSGAVNAVTTTDSNGNYTFTGLPNGSYAVTPSNPGSLPSLPSGYQFLPYEQNVMIGGSNVQGVNFTSSFVVPGSTQYILRDFGATGAGPAYLSTQLNTLQLFEQPSFVPNFNAGTVTPPQWSTIGTPDAFNYQGRLQMPGQLLLAPGTGSLNGKIYQIVAEGAIVIPNSATSAGFSLTMNQNYTVYNTPIVSDALFSQAPPISLAAGTTTNWYLIATLAGNGVGNPTLSSAGILSVNGVVSFGSGFSSRLVGREPVIQLSMGVTFSGSGGGSPFQAYLTKFQMIQTSH